MFNDRWKKSRSYPRLHSSLDLSAARQLKFMVDMENEGIRGRGQGDMDTAVLGKPWNPG